MLNFQNSDQQDQARQGFGISNEFTFLESVINDDEVLQLLGILKKETIADGVISKNRLKQILENYISGETSFTSFEQLLDEKANDLNQRIALENLYKEIAPLQYYQEVIASRIRRQRADRGLITLVDLINEVNKIFTQQQPDSAIKSELINSLIKFYNIHDLRILSLDLARNQNITFEDLRILPDNFKELLIEKLVLLQLSQNQEMGIKAQESALLDVLQLNDDAEEFSEEQLSIRKTLQEKLFLNLIKEYQSTHQLSGEYRDYFDEFDYDLKFKIVSKIWQKTQQSLGDKLPESLLLILRDSPSKTLEDVAFGLLKSARENLKFDDFKQVVDAFCQNKLSNNPLRSLAVFEDDRLEYARQDQIQVNRITTFYLIPTIKNARQSSDASQASSLRFQLAKYALASFIDNFFSHPSDPLISLDSFKEIISAIEENNRYPLTAQEFRELCLIYKTINSSSAFDQYVSSRGVSLTIAEPAIAEPRLPITYTERFNQFREAFTRTQKGSSSQKLSSATLNTIAKEVNDEILEAKMLLNLSSEKLQDDLPYKLFQKLSLSQLPTNLDQFLLELKNELATNDDLKFTDLKKILFYSDRLLKGLGIPDEQISYYLKGLLVFYSQTKLTNFDPKEKKLLDDLLLSYDENSFSALNPATFFNVKNLPSTTKFNYFLKSQLSADDFVEELSKYYLTQEEIYVLAKRFILDYKDSIADMESFLSQVAELVCGSQNQQSKILFKKNLAKEVGALHDIDSQGIDLFLRDFSLREQFLSELNIKLKSLTSASSFDDFKSYIKQFLDNYVGQDLKDRYLAVQYIAQKINKKIPELRPWYMQLQNSTLEIVVPAIDSLDQSRQEFVIALNQIIEKQYSDYRDQSAITVLLRDIQNVFTQHTSLNSSEIKLFLNILFTHKIAQNNYAIHRQFNEGDLENLKRNLLSTLEIQQYPKPDLLQMQSRIVSATRLDDEIFSTCCNSLRDAVIKFGSQVYQCVPRVRNPFSSLQTLTSKQIFKLKILEFVNQMRHSNFEEVMSAVALQIDRFKGGLTFHEKADLVIKLVLDYQLSKRDSLEVVGSRILTTLKFCSIEPNRLDEAKLNSLKTILTANGIIGNISRNDFVLTSLPNYNHHKLLNDIYSNNLSQLSTALIGADISIESNVSEARQGRIDRAPSTRSEIIGRPAGADLVFGSSRARSLHQRSGGPAPVSFDLGGYRDLPPRSQTRQALVAETLNLALDSQESGIQDSPPLSPSDNFKGVVAGGYNNRSLGIRNDGQDSPPPPPPPARTQAQGLRRASTMQPAVRASEISQDKPSSSSSQPLSRVRSLDSDRPAIWA